MNTIVLLSILLVALGLALASMTKDLNKTLNDNDLNDI
jgi:hypothetical protein